MREAMKQKLSEVGVAASELKSMLSDFEKEFAADIRRHDELKAKTDAIEKKILALQTERQKHEEEFSKKQKADYALLAEKEVEIESRLAEAQVRLDRATILAQKAEAEHVAANEKHKQVAELKDEWARKVEKAKSLVSQM